MRWTQTELAAHASLLVPHMQPAPRQVCLAECGHVLDPYEKVPRILETLRSFFAPEVVDAIRQQVARFVNFRRSGQSVD